METVARPCNWAEAGLETAVFSDPGPTSAVIAAIHERESLFSSDYDTFLKPVELVRDCQPEARRDRSDFRQIVREVPNRLMASIIYHKIQLLSQKFVDLDYDYAARDWSEFPVMLSERFARGEHPMAWCPDYSDPESDEACAAWRAFLADARWWLDRMHVVALGAGEWRFGRKIDLGSSGNPVYSRTVLRIPNEAPQVSEQGEHIADAAALQETVTDGSFADRSSNYRLLSFVVARVEQRAECSWSSSSQDLRWYLRNTSRLEYVSGTSYANLRVRNHYPTAASVVVYACGAGSKRGNYAERSVCVRSDTLVDFEYAEQSPVGHNPTLASASEVSRKAYWPSALASGDGAVFDETISDLSSGTRTLRGWSHDFSEFEDPPRVSQASSVSTTYGPLAELPPAVVAERIWAGVPRPGLLGLQLGPNVLATLAPGARTADLLPWNAAGADAVRAETWWLPAALHEYDEMNEHSDASATFCVAIVPCLDFEGSFRFKADADASASESASTPTPAPAND